MKISIIETYNNSPIPFGSQIQKTEIYTEMETMYPFPSDSHYLPHCKCVLWCYANCPSIVIHDEE